MEKCFEELGNNLIQLKEDYNNIRFVAVKLFKTLKAMGLNEEEILMNFFQTSKNKKYRDIGIIISAIVNEKYSDEYLVISGWIHGLRRVSVAKNMELCNYLNLAYIERWNKSTYGLKEIFVPCVRKTCSLFASLIFQIDTSGHTYVDIKERLFRYLKESNISDEDRKNIMGYRNINISDIRAKTIKDITINIDNKEVVMKILHDYYNKTSELNNNIYRPIRDIKYENDITKELLRDRNLDRYYIDSKIDYIKILQHSINILKAAGISDISICRIFYTDNISMYKDNINTLFYLVDNLNISEISIEMNRSKSRIAERIKYISRRLMREVSLLYDKLYKGMPGKQYISSEDMLDIEFVNNLYDDVSIFSSINTDIESLKKFSKILEGISNK